jgi:siroheme decarboxylase
MEAPLETRAGPDRAALLNAWQRDLPLVPRPFDALGAPHRLDGAAVRALLREALARGEASRVGAVFGVGAGGAAMLCALAVAPERLDAVARAVDAEPGVSHNYAREHAWNLWFVASARDEEALAATIGRIERRTGLAALRLPMRRAWRIDLGFDLFGASRSAAAARPAVPVEPAWRPLAARLEALGVPLVERPYAALGAPLGLDEASVMATLARWCEQGTLRRLGVVLRHHEFGIAANAMTVFAPPEDAIDAAGEVLAAQPGVTLCYRRASAEQWPYTLYCMVHGRERAVVRRAIDAATRAAGLEGVPREVLFSTRRYKQTGSRYFAEAGVA